MCPGGRFAKAFTMDRVLSQRIRPRQSRKKNRTQNRLQSTKIYVSRIYYVKACGPFTRTEFGGQMLPHNGSYNGTILYGVRTRSLKFHRRTKFLYIRFFFNVLLLCCTFSEFTLPYNTHHIREAVATANTGRVFMNC